MVYSQHTIYFKNAQTESLLSGKPVSKYTWGGDKIKFDNSSLNVFQNSGCYFQGFENIQIGKMYGIAQNVGIITANHDLKNPDLHTLGKPVSIGDKCWIGMNS